MKVVIGSDHAGFELKEKIKDFLKESGYSFEDAGTNSPENVDYPIYAKKVAEAVKKDQNALGILICGTGLGMCITANKVTGIRAALCYNENSAKLAREHNKANILCLGGREFKEDLAKNITKKFLETPFGENERHVRRIKEITDLEK